LNAHHPELRLAGRNELTDLAAFCQSLCAAHAVQCQRQLVSLACDIPDNLKCEIPQRLVHRILDAWILESLKMMPHGGELDIVVVQTAHGLEIEVADSREDWNAAQDDEGWHRRMRISDGAVADSRSEIALQVEATACPQGGIARTLRVPIRTRHESTVAPSMWRKVA
jgi:hypothetical protein